MPQEMRHIDKSLHLQKQSGNSVRSLDEPKKVTGCLTTVEELEAMLDVQLEPIRVLCNLQLVGECPPILKICDVIPFLKD